MIKLDEKDVKQVARGRFFRKWKKPFIGIPLGLFGGLLIVIFALKDSGSNNWVIPVLIVIVVGLFIGALLYARGETRAEKALLKEWKKE